ncbi:hypothetical protein [Paenibacillus sp. RC84]|uniref:hypothetical protein n=1 Tax=Paenibacillus sp. RC84 TaxID=3156252 RepID=UPI003517000B
MITEFGYKNLDYLPYVHIKGGRTSGDYDAEIVLPNSGNEMRIKIAQIRGVKKDPLKTIRLEVYEILNLNQELLLTNGYVNERCEAPDQVPDKWRQVLLEEYLTRTKK